VVILKFVLIATMAAATSIAKPDELLEVVRYGPSKMWARCSAHCNHCLCSLDTLLFALATRDQQGINLTAVQTIVIPVETVLKLPEVPVSGGEDSDRLAMLAGATSCPVFLCAPVLQLVPFLTDLDGDAAKRGTQQGHVLCSPKHGQPLRVGGLRCAVRRPSELVRSHQQFQKLRYHRARAWTRRHLYRHSENC
jgi:hypothetical protein